MATRFGSAAIVVERGYACRGSDEHEQRYSRSEKRETGTRIPEKSHRTELEKKWATGAPGIGGIFHLGVPKCKREV